MNELPASGPILLGALAGCLAVLATREGLLGVPGTARWLSQAVEPMVRAGREGYLPSRFERRRLATLGVLATIACGWILLGPGVALPLAIAAPAVIGWLVNRRNNRYRRSVEKAIPDIANTVADSVGAGRSMRGALADLPESLDGPAAVETARLRAELDLGVPTAAALGQLRSRVRSDRIDSFVTALQSTMASGGDLADLMRRFAEGAAERDRVAEDARSATAQARFTGALVVAMPTGAALFAELLQPGFLGRIVGSGPGLFLLGVALAFQVGGFLAIKRLSRVRA